MKLKYIFILFILLRGIWCCATQLDLARAAAMARPGGAAKMPNLRKEGELRCVDFTARFTNDTHVRATWDIPLNADLSQMAGIHIRLACTNIALANQLSVYMRCQGTWAAATFEIRNNMQWEDVFIPKTNFTFEGRPGTWKNCDLLRLAVWKNGPGNLSLQIAELEFKSPNTSLAILRGDGHKGEKSLRESARHAKNLNNALIAQGILPAIIDESDITLTILRPYKMLLVPFPESVAPSQRDSVISYLRSGGKAGLFHSLGPALAAQMNVPVGRYMAVSQIPGAVGGVLPSSQRFPGVSPFRQLSSALIAVESIPVSSQATAWWMNCEGQRTRWPAIIENSSGFWMTHVFMNQDSHNGGLFLKHLLASYVPGIRKDAAEYLLTQAEFAFSSTRRKEAAVLQESGRCLGEARRQYRAGNHDSAAYWATAGMNALGTMAASSGRVPVNEFRGIWCRYPNGIPGHTWRQTMERLSVNGINNIFTLTATPYMAAYSSRLLMQESGEGLPGAVEAAAVKGMKVHAWVNCLGVEDAPETVLAQWKKQGRLQLDHKGSWLNWLCPNHPDNKLLLSRITSEIVSKYKVDGVHFDRIRYPGKESCYCMNCRKAFEAETGLPTRNWPTCVRGEDYKEAWQKFRIKSIDNILCEMVNAAMTANKSTYISAAVYPDGVQAGANVGQDWENWCRRRFVSFVCPMNYRSSTGLFTGDIQRQVKRTGGPAMLVSGIGTGPGRLDADELARQISAARNAGIGGFAVFDLGQREAYELLPAMKERGIIQ